MKTLNNFSAIDSFNLLFSFFESSIIQLQIDKTILRKQQRNLKIFKKKWDKVNFWNCPSLNEFINDFSSYINTNIEKF